MKNTNTNLHQTFWNVNLSPNLDQIEALSGFNLSEMCFVILGYFTKWIATDLLRTMEENYEKEGQKFEHHWYKFLISTNSWLRSPIKTMTNLPGNSVLILWYVVFARLCFRSCISNIFRNLYKRLQLCNFPSFVFVGSEVWVLGQRGVNQIVGFPFILPADFWKISFLLILVINTFDLGLCLCGMREMRGESELVDFRLLLPVDGFHTRGP